MRLTVAEQRAETVQLLLLVNDQRDAQILFYEYVFISIYNSLHVSSTSCSSSGETNCINDDEHDVLETCRDLQIEINT